LFDGVAAVTQNAGPAIKVGDRAHGTGSGTKRRVGKPNTRQEAAPGLGVYATIVNGDFDGLAGAVICDADAFGHRGLPSLLQSKIRYFLTLRGSALLNGLKDAKKGEIYI
jgi:hypothetical protein